MNTSDFNSGGNVNMARMVNWLHTLQLGNLYAGGPGTFGSNAVARVGRFIEAHQPVRPCTPSNVRWQSLDALTTHVRHMGPKCSEADVLAAVADLPSGATVGAVVAAAWGAID